MCQFHIFTHDLHLCIMLIVVQCFDFEFEVWSLLFYFSFVSCGYLLDFVWFFCTNLFFLMGKQSGKNKKENKVKKNLIYCVEIKQN